MAIWSGEIKEFEALYTSLKGQFPDLEKELEQLIITNDANVVMLYSRRCLEVIITDLCETELNRPRKTEPLKGIIDKLNKEEKVPSHIITSMLNLNSLSAYGTHPKEFDPEQVKPVLSNLVIIIKWYLKYKDSQTITKPEEQVEDHSIAQDKSNETPDKPKKKLIVLLSGVTLVVIILFVALYLFDIFGGTKQTKELEKSVAVLPFINDSPDEENTYFINGIMEELLLSLQAIKEFQVPGRTSVEQYRNPTMSPPEIAKELDVNYIVEGSGQKYGNTIRLRIQLLDGAKGRHLWGESYEQEIENPEDIFDIQNRIAESIAKELKAIITPEVKQLIEKIPTKSLTAYDFYQQGKDEHWKYWLKDEINALTRAESLYKKALEHDSTFAQAYAGLADIYWDKHYWKEYFTEEFLDSFLILTNIALSYDDQLAEAYLNRGIYYRQIGNNEQALNEYNKALFYNPNDWQVYNSIANLCDDEPIKQIENYHKALLLNQGPQRSTSLKNLGYVYMEIGFMERARNYYQDALALDEDSISYLRGMIFIEACLENWDKVLGLQRERLRLGSPGFYPIIFNMTGNHDELYSLYAKLVVPREHPEGFLVVNAHRIGVALWKMGKYEEAEEFFNQQVQYCIEIIELGRALESWGAAYYDLAGAYSCLGDKQKAINYLNECNKRRFFPSWWVVQLKVDPLFENIRDEPGYQQIVKDVEAKYQAEHERVRKWLDEQGMY